MKTSSLKYINSSSVSPYLIKMLKAQLHIHTKEDPDDNNFVKYTAKELIYFASKQNFEVLAITCHNKVVFDEKIQEYAQQKDILLIPAVERAIDGKHVLIYNISENESQKINSFEDLESWRNEKKTQNQPTLVIAAHPFFHSPTCLKNKIIEHLDLFDAWEYSFFYTRLFNPNKKMVKLSRKYSKPILGNADVHKLTDLNRTYSLINSEKNIASFFKAIKNNQIKVITKPLSIFHFLKTILWVILAFPFKRLKKI